MYSICIIISDQPLLFWLLLCSHFIIFFLVKKRKPLFSNPIRWSERFSNSNILSAYHIKWLFRQIYNRNLIIGSIVIYFTIINVKFIGKKNEIRKWRIFTSALSCSRFSILPKDSAKSFQRRTAHGRWPTVNLNEGVSNLFLFPILRECASTISLSLLQIRGWASPLTCVK